MAHHLGREKTPPREGTRTFYITQSIIITITSCPIDGHELGENRLIQVLMSELGISQAQLLVSFSSIIGSRCILRKNMEKALSRKRYGLLDYPNETISNGTRFLGRGFHCWTSCIRFNLSIPVARSFESGYVRICFQQLSGFEYHKSREELMFFNV
ncbi:hypothetical protein FB446DRAFT_391095 [Lentinula raphanica]|nr:hypothetical protein FB446DRAFT_391095 [Lentinula raphanica]